MIDFSKGRKYIIGLVHLLPLPGTPFHQEDSLQENIQKAVTDALALQRGTAQA